MPRPTPAQLAYGVLTVVSATLAMLLLSETRSVAGVAVIAVAALALGLLVSLTAAPRTGTAAPAPRTTAAAPRGFRDSRAAGELPSHRTTSQAHPRERAQASVHQ